jgi:hypothetical protein
MEPRHEIHVMCPGCGDEVHHRCGEQGPGALRDALLQLLTWHPHWVEPSVKKAIQKAGEASGWIEKGSDFSKTPFFGGEPWTYGMFDKEDGRSVVAYINAVIRACGFDPAEIRKAAWAILDKQDAERKRLADRREEIGKERADAIKLFGSKAPLAKKIERLDAILAYKSEILNPLADDDDGGGGWGHLHKWLKEQYGGGINPTVNRQRIEHCRKVAIETGVFALHLYGTKGDGRGVVAIFSKRFQSYDAALRTLTAATTVKQDGTSKDPFARAVYARLRANGDSGETYVRDASGAWTREPSKEG